MRILQINSVYGFGSTGKIVASIHHDLLSRGEESFVIFSRKPTNNADMTHVTRFYSGMGTALHAGLALLLDRHGLYSRFNTKKMIEKIEEISPDIVHLHVIHGFYCHYPMLFDYLRKTNRKIIWTQHDCWAYTGYCAYYDYNECFKWKEHHCENCKYRNTYPYRILSNSKNNFQYKQQCYENQNLTLVSCSKWLDQEIAQSMMKKLPHCVINNSVNLSSFYYDANSALLQKYGLDGKKVVLAVANVWTIQKGMRELIKLSSILTDEVKLVMIGLSSKQIKQLPDNIVKIGRVDVDELRQWYSNATVFVNCTLEDNYPTVNLEAKACGLPIITYRTGGSVEMIGENGYIVERYDVDAIKEIIEKKSLKRKVEKNKTRMEDEYYKLYQSLI